MTNDKSNSPKERYGKHKKTVMRVSILISGLSDRRFRGI